MALDDSYTHLRRQARYWRQCRPSCFVTITRLWQIAGQQQQSGSAALCECLASEDQKQTMRLEGNMASSQTWCRGQYQPYALSVKEGVAEACISFHAPLSGHGREPSINPAAPLSMEPGLSFLCTKHHSHKGTRYIRGIVQPHSRHSHSRGDAGRTSAQMDVKSAI